MLKEIQTLLERMLESQNQILLKMDRLESKFENIADQIKQFTSRQEKFEKEFEMFKINIVEQVSKELLRTKRVYH